MPNRPKRMRAQIEVPQVPESSLARLVEIAEEYDAAAFGYLIDQWRALPEHEKTAVREFYEHSDRAKSQGLTLQAYRERLRKSIEREPDGSRGLPQWLRDIYAAENPEARAVFYLKLVMDAAVALPARLKELKLTVSANTGSGLVGDFEEPVEERVLREVQRSGLEPLYREAERQLREGAN